MSSVKAKRDSKEENIFSLPKLYCVVPIILNMLYSLISHMNSIHIHGFKFQSEVQFHKDFSGCSASDRAPCLWFLTMPPRSHNALHTALCLSAECCQQTTL